MNKRNHAQHSTPNAPHVEGVSTPFVRDYTVDNYRGFVIFIVFLWCCVFLFVPSDQDFLWVWHTDAHGVDIGFGMMDYGIMMFLLATGLVMNVTFSRKVASGQSPKQTRIAYLRRGLTVMGVGCFNLAFLTVGLNSVHDPYGWEVFMNIGFSSMLASFFLGRKKWVRVLSGALFLAVYALISEFIPIVHQSLLSDKLSYGGPFAAIGLTGMLLWFTVLGDLFQEKNKRNFLLGILAAWLLAIPPAVLSFRSTTGAVSNLVYADLTPIERIFCVSFNNFSTGFILFGGGIALLTFLPWWGISALLRREIPLLSTMGKNTVPFFFLYGICNLPAEAIADAFPNRPVVGCLLNALLVLVLTLPLAYLFERKKIVIKA